MAAIHHYPLLERIAGFDMQLCHRLNRTSRLPGITRLFSFFSRLGDGPLWGVFALLLLAVPGQESWRLSLRMVLAGLIGIAVYKAIKYYTRRPRPYAVNGNINLGTAPLDQYSFPSGHTLHATSMTILICHDSPEFSWALIPFALLIAASRMVLGLHYPTDVAFGAAIGGAVAVTTLYLI